MVTTNEHEFTRIEDQNSRPAGLTLGFAPYRLPFVWIRVHSWLNSLGIRSSDHRMKKRSAPKAPKIPAQPPLLAPIVRALDDKKAEDLVVIDVTGLSSVTDYLVIATGNSEPHLRALRIVVEKVLDDSGTPIAGRDTGNFSGWVVLDAYQIMVHVFTERKREAYNLEMLWRDGKRLDVAALLKPDAPARKPRKAKKDS
jgi:ribosome-associated protein